MQEAQKIIKVSPLGFPWQTQDPFLFCAYHKDDYPKGNENLGPDESLLEGRNIGEDFIIKDGWRMYHGKTIPGFPYHPHRGFETITIAKEGLIDHSDSLGASGRFGSGDVQWMTAGRGIQHSEMFPLFNQDKGNPLEIFQVWLNLPKVSKMVEPHFKMLWNEDIPLVKQVDDNGKTVEINVIAGKLNDVDPLAPTPDSWAANNDNNVAVWTIKMEAGSSWMIPKASAEANRTIYFYSGDTITIEGETVQVDSSIELKADEEVSISVGNEDAYLLLLQGRPINEPVAQHGPFVMNTQEEIQRAFYDYQRTEFGGWPWPEKDQVHDRSKGRFAEHSDGRTESK